ncbi:MAG: phage tail protein [Fibrobacter sp.]|jgi:phage tail-like protein|nr:phage tail protein [Fibrobacter sp.]
MSDPSRNNQNRLNNPVSAYNFKLEIDGIQVAGFSEITGLNAETEVEPLKEGGLNDSVHMLVKGTKYGNIVMKKGILSSETLYAWYCDTIRGKIKRKNVSIHLYDSSYQNANETAVRTWNFRNAFPIKWDGPVFNAASSAIAMESITMVHEGMFPLPKNDE